MTCSTLYFVNIKYAHLSYTNANHSTVMTSLKSILPTPNQILHPTNPNTHFLNSTPKSSKIIL